MSNVIPATIVNHAMIAIAATPASVWEVILEQFVDVERLGEFGVVTPLDDHTAPLGGYHMQLDLGEGKTDRRIVRITEYDPVELRLSLFADFLSVPGGMKAYITYHAQSVAEGARFAVDCHLRLQLDVPDGATRADVVDMIAEKTASGDEQLAQHMKAVRSRLEGQSN